MNTNLAAAKLAEGNFAVGPDNPCRLILLQILLSLGTLISMAKAPLFRSRCAGRSSGTVS